MRLNGGLQHEVGLSAQSLKLHWKYRGPVLSGESVWYRGDGRGSVWKWKQEMKSCVLDIVSEKFLFKR